MRRLISASAVLFASLFVALLAVLAVTALAPTPAWAQQGLPQPPHELQPLPPPPIEPYQPVAATPPQPFGDPSFDAFRKTLAAAADHQDRAALAKLVVTQGFFWIQDKDVADRSKPGIDNLAKAIGLDANNGFGWDILANAAADPTAAAVPQEKDIYCAPAPPIFDPRAAGALLQQTGTDPSDWGYPTEQGTEVRAAAQPNAPVIAKLAMVLVHVLPDSPSPAGAAAPTFLHVALPSGKTGFVAAEMLAPLISDQICYVKAASGWLIAGYIGGVSP
jgi:hypothetical protein